MITLPSPRQIVRLSCIAFVMLLACTTTTVLHAASWRAGFASELITPTTPMYLSGYSERTGVATGIETELRTKAAILEDENGQRLAVVNIELVDVPPELIAQIKASLLARFGWPADHVIISCTHTHSAPEAYGDASETRAYRTLVHDRSVRAVVRAFEQMVDVHLFFGKGEASFAMNRRFFTASGYPVFGRNPDGPVDQDVPVLAARSMSGTLVGLLFGYSTHATTLTGSFNRVCGDYVGYAQEKIETDFPGATAVFLQGCSADSDPDERGTVAYARQHGHELAAAVSTVLGQDMNSVNGPLAVRSRFVDLPLHAPTRIELNQWRNHMDRFRRQWAEWLTAALDQGATLPTRLTYPVQAVQFGEDLTLVAFAGEVVVDFALRLKREMGEKRLWVLGYTNESVGYVPSDRILGEGGYESHGLGVGSVLAPGGEDRIIAAAHDVVHATGQTDLVNLSTRARIGTDAEAMIAGFVVRGEGSLTLLLRAAGPALAPYGVTGYAPQPELRLFSGSTVLVANRGWESEGQGNSVRNAATQTGAFSFAAGTADSALLVTLSEGAYTAQVTPVAGTPAGVALVEVYVVNRSGTARLVNVSTRAQVGFSGEELIAGFVLKGSGRQRLLMRAAGPELRRQGVSSVLDDPVMTAFRGNVAVSTNDDWSSGAFTNPIGTAAGVVGAFEFSSQTKDSALLSLFEPANYTVVVSNRSAVPGIALVEVYAVPQ